MAHMTAHWHGRLYLRTRRPDAVVTALSRDTILDAGGAKRRRPPWERPMRARPDHPRRVRRGFRNIRAASACPAGTPKPRQTLPRRWPGSQNRRSRPSFVSVEVTLLTLPRMLADRKCRFHHAEDGIFSLRACLLLIPMQSGTSRGRLWAESFPGDGVLLPDVGLEDFA
jgi:hypothetical protein